MEIKKIQNDSELTIAINGRLDTNAAPKLIAEMDECLVEGVKAFVLDMADCDYVASSGLRAILGAQKKMNSLQGTMVVKNVVSDVMEVFEMTGFADILNFE
ncbi:MAG: STAS domain-containing protein [Lachnospiraceae bacterium]|nr:STAS domain-containing protein [Lachnospiraceae bacterium]MBQ9934923.1 STAS domain-containing protein [Lachnospiraceae bacterium]